MFRCCDVFRGYQERFEAWNELITISAAVKNAWIQIFFNNGTGEELFKNQRLMTQNHSDYGTPKNENIF